MKIAKNNVIYFIIDSLNYRHLNTSTLELMPFLNSLKKKGLSCENMYSQAPYTEAAVMNLYCGQDVLQNGGYLYRFKNAEKTIFEIMKENGYATYYNSYQPQCHPSSIKRGITDLYYNVGYDVIPLWSYRLSHYSCLFNNNELKVADYLALEEIFNDNFSEWLNFLDDYINLNKSVEMIFQKDINYNATSIKEMVIEELNKFKKDSKKYIFEVLKEGKNHKLFSIPSFIQHNKINNREIIPQVKELFDPLFRKIKKKNFSFNIRNERKILKGPFFKGLDFLKSPNKSKLKNLANATLLSSNLLFDFDLYDRINIDCDWFKNAPSGITHINHFNDWVEKNGEKPFFACIHVDDIHNPEEFFTYDTDNIELLKQEKENSEKIISKIDNTYHGSITHDLSLNYADQMISYLYESLEKNNLLENTYVVICADHGFSFSGNPLRDSCVTNLYLENYQIPFVMTGPGIIPSKINKLCSSKDIPATICKYVLGSVPSAFSGRCVTDDFEYSNVFIEYCGGGCPDLTRRELKIASFNESYFVGTLCKLYDDIGQKNITEVYDLIKDPMQYNNLAKKNYDSDKVVPLVNAINKRKQEIIRTIIY